MQGKLSVKSFLFIVTFHPFLETASRSYSSSRFASTSTIKESIRCKEALPTKNQFYRVVPHPCKHSKLKDSRLEKRRVFQQEIHFVEERNYCRGIRPGNFKMNFIYPNLELILKFCPLDLF